MGIEIFGTKDHLHLKRAGKVAAQTLEGACAMVHANMSTATIDEWVRKDTKRRGAHPSQLGYHGFPAAVCTSRNHVVCHGIPSTSETMKQGDIINIDVTSQLDGFHGDTSRTIPVGKVSVDAKHIISVAERCRDAGIATVRNGSRLGDIGHAIQSLAEREGCSVVREYGGHGIGRKMHTEPHVPHVGEQGRGLRLKTGMVLTVEPMVNLGRPEVVTQEDGWTVMTRDGSLSAQFEHTILVTENGCCILTQL